jgi:hypothetical protein
MNHPPRIVAKPKPSVPVLVALAIMAAAVILLIAIAAAAATPACMTEGEARATFPRAHLYWHGQHHCWDNRGPLRPVATRPPRPYIDPNGNRAELNGVRWYPRPFDLAVEPLDPPVVLGVVEYRWPGSNVADSAPVLVIEPITVVAELEFNEIDAGAAQ